MRFDWNKLLIDFDGEPIKVNPNDKDSTKTWTLGLWCRAALSATFQDEKELSGDESYRRGALARKISDNLEESKAHNFTSGVKPNEDFKSDEVELAKKCVGKMRQNAITFQVWEMLDDPLPKKKSAADNT